MSCCPTEGITNPWIHWFYFSANDQHMWTYITVSTYVLIGFVQQTMVDFLLSWYEMISNTKGYVPESGQQTNWERQHKTGRKIEHEWLLSNERMMCHKYVCICVCMDKSSSRLKKSIQIWFEYEMHLKNDAINYVDGSIYIVVYIYVCVRACVCIYRSAGASTFICLGVYVWSRARKTWDSIDTRFKWKKFCDGILKKNVTKYQ